MAEIPEWCREGYVCIELREYEQDCLGKGDDCAMEAGLAFGAGILGTVVGIAFVGWLASKLSSLWRPR